MAQLQLQRPLGIGGVFAHTFIVYGRRFGAMAMVTLSFLVIPLVLILMGDCGVDPYTGDEVCGNALGSIGLIAFGISGLIAGTVVVLEAASAYVDLPADWPSVASTGLRKVLPILAAGILIVLLWFVPVLILLLLGASIGFATFIGVILLILLEVSFHWFGAALMIEGLGPMASLGRSWRLVSGERLRLFGVFLVFFIAFFIGGGISLLALFVPIGLLGEGVAGFLFYLAQTAWGVVFIPLLSSFTTVLYLDLRVRKEGLDEGTLAAELSRWRGTGPR